MFPFSSLTNKTALSGFLVLIFMICLFESCGNGSNETALSKNDKDHIEQAVINNVEAIRRVLLCNTNGWYYGEAYDSIPDYLPRYSGDCFWGYAIYKKGNKAFAVPRPACEWLDVKVENLHYSSDSIKCVALTTIGYSEENQMNADADGKVVYDGKAILGIRNSKTDQFKIYPMSVMSFLCFPSRGQVAKLLRRFYYNLKGSSPSGAKFAYECGINRPKFFETANEFLWIDSLKLYWGETHMVPGGRRVPYRFYSNQDSTINKNLCE